MCSEDKHDCSSHGKIFIVIFVEITNHLDSFVFVFFINSPNVNMNVPFVVFVDM